MCVCLCVCVRRAKKKLGRALAETVGISCGKGVKGGLQHHSSNCLSTDGWKSADAHECNPKQKRKEKKKGLYIFLFFCLENCWECAEASAGSYYIKI